MEFGEDIECTQVEFEYFHLKTWQLLNKEKSIGANSVIFAKILVLFLFQQFAPLQTKSR